MKTVIVVLVWLLSHAAASAQEATKVDPLVARTNELISTARQDGYAGILSLIIPVDPKGDQTKEGKRQEGIEDFGAGLRTIEINLLSLPPKEAELFKFDDVKLGKKEDGNSDCTIFTLIFPESPHGGIRPVGGYSWRLEFRRAKDDKSKSVWKLYSATRKTISK
jgi:hypothetical protein